MRGGSAVEDHIPALRLSDIRDVVRRQSRSSPDDKIDAGGATGELLAVESRPLGLLLATKSALLLVLNVLVREVPRTPAPLLRLLTKELRPHQSR